MVGSVANLEEVRCEIPGCFVGDEISQVCLDQMEGGAIERICHASRQTAAMIIFPFVGPMPSMSGPEELVVKIRSSARPVFIVVAATGLSDGAHRRYARNLLGLGVNGVEKTPRAALLRVSELVRL